MISYFLLWILILLQLPFAEAALYRDLAELPRLDFDYIVIGAGPGGSVVAARLSENINVKILLVEAGPEQDQFKPNGDIPFLSPTLTPGTPLDWNYTTTPQEGLNGRVIPYARGKLLGGSSSVNYMAWTRGSAEDFNRYANITGDAGWSWDSVEPLFKRIERLVPPADNHNTTGEIIPFAHGTSGPLGISVQGWPDAIIPRIFKSTQELPEEYRFNEDMNTGNPLGVGTIQWTIRNGSRSSAANSYIDPNLSRPNLFVLVNTLATKLIQTGAQKGVPVFRSAVLSASTGLNRAVNATKEIIVSGGAINTPQLLLLSGIGNKTELESLNITSIVDLPGVGRNLHDHTTVSLQWSVRSNSTLDNLNRNATLFNETLMQWLDFRKGIFASGPILNIGWLRLPDHSAALKLTRDPSAGPHSPHYEIFFQDQFLSRVSNAPAEGHYMSIRITLVTPTARGFVTINSTNPLAKPIVNPNLLGSQFDLIALSEAVDLSRRIVQAPVWQDYIIEPFGSEANLTSSNDFQEFVRSTGWTIFHPVGTCAMGSADDMSDLVVVNPDLTVKGTAGLRIVDASVLPIIPGAHTQAAVYVFAERAAVLIGNT